MSNAGVKLDTYLLAHMALHHSPESHSTTKQVIIATSEASNSALAVSGVLNQINELVRDGDSNSTNTSSSLNTRFKSKSTAYEKCSNGLHNPKTAHSEDSCWQTHPEKNPHKSQSNTASITGRVLSTLAKNGNLSGKPILDTACSQTMIHDKKLFDSYQAQQTNIEVAGGDLIDGIGLGRVTGNHKGMPLLFSDFLHVPSLKSNLISMINLAKKGCSIVFNHNRYFEVIQDKDTVLSGPLVNGVMELDITLGESTTHSPRAMTTRTNGITLHRRLDHSGPRPFEKVDPNTPYPKHCDPCVLLKHHRLPYRGHFETATSKLYIIHSDLSGIITPPSLGGARYFFKITDSCTSFKFVFLLSHKSDTLSSFMKFKACVENLTSYKIKTMINDNGGEYLSNEFKKFIKYQEIFMNTTAPYTPQQNPVAEIGNRTTVEKARALLKQAGLPNEFWAEAVSTAVYLENLTPIASQNFFSPYELWHKKAPPYNHLRVFGCLSYVHVRKEQRSSKFLDTAKRVIFLGYQEGHHNYRIWLLEEEKLVYSHDVVFNEDCFPYKHCIIHSDSLSDPETYEFLIPDSSIDDSSKEDPPANSKKEDIKTASNSDSEQDFDSATQ